MAKEKLKLSKEQYKSLEMVTKRFILSYPQVFEKGVYQGKETNFNFTMLVKKTAKEQKDDEALKPFRQKLALAKQIWLGNDPKKWPKGMANPIKDGDAENDEGNKPAPGYWMIKATSANKIPVYDASPDPQPITEKSDVYAGAVCRATIQAAYYDIGKLPNGELNHGVKFYASGLQKMAEGERLGSGGNSKRNFVEVGDDEVEGDNPEDYGDDAGGEESAFDV